MCLHDETFRLALDSIQRKYEEELNDKLRNLTGCSNSAISSQASTSADVRSDVQHSRHSAVEIQNRRLQREIRQKDAVIEELRQKVTFLERRVADLTGEELPLRYGRIRSFSSGLFFTFAYYDMILLLIHQRHEGRTGLIFD
ncbi:unnamed protein product [Gongylonema pulchrum]|uniref:RH1 domain-containing protein n=1 Tax=Gongylonema pulchrum TaxID=637853 RepID=A0A183EMC5_9BILA|nr:unnamed protein product [Gongylonema pulchrum]